ncbi:MAG TPA: histidinol-phosphatase [Myxococcaceae bacterium]|jgi:histidinol phosphatase-like enzyme (inositol monophosphatase family)|nr:histidinol-phosphatase [Myxococcaceae bacterium]
MKQLLLAVDEVARRAGAVALQHFRQAIEVEVKSDRSPVTVADRAAEAAARALIEEKFPRDGIVGEEHGTVRPDARRRWIIDPIDGTRSFVRGVPLWGTLIAVAEGNEVLAGCMGFPATDEWIAAARGEGAWYNGGRCRVSDLAEMERAAVLTTDERFPMAPEWRAPWRELSARVELSRTWGDCYGYLLVATGRAELMIDPVLADWDSASLMPIIEEAGGVFTDVRGRRTAFGGSALATNAALAKQLRVALGVGAVA